MKQNNIWTIIKKYGKKSIFFRYVISSMTIILLIFIPFVLFISTYYNYVLTQELSRQATISALQSKNIFEILTSDFHSNYELAVNSQDVNTFLNSPSEDLPSQQETQAFINTLLNSSDLAINIFIYSFKNEICISSNEIIQLGGKESL